MAVSQYTWKVLRDQMQRCVDLDDAEITETAKKIAFYMAMIDAGKDDPFDDVSDHAEITAYLKNNLQELIETYQNLVNEKL
jgi:hypothetical protein